MAEFLTLCLGVKNDRYKILKAAVCGLLLFLNIIICPLLTDVEMVSVAIMLVIETAYIVFFLKGKNLQKDFCCFYKLHSIDFLRRDFASYTKAIDFYN